MSHFYKPTIGIIGMGVVGRAIARDFIDRGFTVFRNDKLKRRRKKSKKELLQNCQIIFVCVPTPFKDGKPDISQVTDVLSDLNRFQQLLLKRPLIVIKSTIPPGTTDWYHSLYGRLWLAHSPEFLTAQDAYADASQPDRVVCGVYDDAATDLLRRIFRRVPYPPFIVCTPIEAELSKYLSNIFLTLKVAYANASVEYCKVFGVEAKIPMWVVGLDKRIVANHLNPDMGKIARDSPCLPKDLDSFIYSFGKAAEKLEHQGCVDPDSMHLLHCIKYLAIEPLNPKV